MTEKKPVSVVVPMVTMFVMAAMLLIGCSTDSPVAPTVTVADSQQCRIQCRAFTCCSLHRSSCPG